MLVKEIQRTNPGGILSPEEVIGRDALISQLWRTLQSQGLYLTGERRMGKSSIVRDKMGNAAPNGYRLVYFDVSDAATPLAFVEGLFRAAKKTADSGGRLKLTALELLRRVHRLEITPLFKLPESLAPDWKEMLRAVLADFANAETQMILAFDELPMMADKIKRNAGEAVAMDVLDTLRKERQSDRRLRMLYTGSLGLHHVLTDLRSADYQNAPLNDLRLVEAEPLQEEDATELAWRLLNGMSIATNDPEPLARHLARITNGMPFYIQNLADALSDCGSNCTPETADRLLTQRLHDLNDPWDLGYYKTRIDTHYQTPLQPIALALLDHLSRADNPQTFDDLRDGLDPKKVKADEETILRTLELLGKDHYIARDDDGAYKFRYPLIARSWTYQRGLTGRNRR